MDREQLLDRSGELHEQIGMTRRTFLSGSVSTVALSSASLTVGVFSPSTARAEAVVAAIAAAVAIAAAIAGLFAKGDGTRQQFAILNAKLNHIVDLQNKTLEAIATVSNQVAALQTQIPDMLRSEAMRQRLVDADDFSSRLLRLEDRVDRWRDSDTQTLDDMAKEAWDQVSLLRSELRRNPADGEIGIDIVRHAMPALFSAYQFLPALRSIDEKIGLKDQRLAQNKNLYRDLVADVRDAIKIFATKHLQTQLTFQTSQVEASKKILNGNPYSQWLKHLESFTPNSSETSNGPRINANTKFGTVATFGPCTHGHNSDDVNWAKDISARWDRYRPGVGLNVQPPPPRNAAVLNWTVFDIVIPTAVWADPLYYRGSRAGFENLSIPLQDAQANKIGYVFYKDLDKAKRRSTALNEGFANTFYPVKEYNCPGTPLHDRTNYSALYARRSKDTIAGKIIEFRKAVLDWTEHHWNVVGVQEMLDWANAIDADIKKMEDVLS